MQLQLSKCHCKLEILVSSDEKECLDFQGFETKLLELIMSLKHQIKRSQSMGVRGAALGQQRAWTILSC